jgi:small subunit ribosomal protein S4e
MVKYHTKRLALPRTWSIPRKSLNRKTSRFVTQPQSGKTRTTTMSVNTIMKELIKLVSTTREVKSILQLKHVLVNGARVRTEKFPVGLLDVIEFQELGRQFRLSLTTNGKLTTVEIDAKEKGTVVRQVLGKKLLKQGKLQLNLSGSANLLIDKNAYAVGDSLIIIDGKITKAIPLATGNSVLLIAGRNCGAVGTIVEVSGNDIFLDVDGSKVQTLKKYAYVVGEKTPAITIQ